MSAAAGLAANSPAALRLHQEARRGAHARITRLLVLALVAAMVLVLRHFLLADNAHPQSHVQRVRLVAAPHPVPPKPPEAKPREEERPKEPEQKPLESYQGQLALLDTPTPGPPGPPGPPGEKPLDDQLGVEAEGEGAGDSFGLVAKRGGHDITRLGGSGGGSGGPSRAQQQMIFRGYGQTVAQRLERELQGSADVLAREYVVVTLVWIDTRGRIVRNELSQSSGSVEIDSALRKALGGAAVLPEPPSGLPLPLKLRFTVREVSEPAPGG